MVRLNAQSDRGKTVVFTKNCGQLKSVMRVCVWSDIAEKYIMRTIRLCWIEFPSNLTWNIGNFTRPRLKRLKFRSMMMGAIMHKQSWFNHPQLHARYTFQLIHISFRIQFIIVTIYPKSKLSNPKHQKTTINNSKSYLKGDEGHRDADLRSGTDVLRPDGRRCGEDAGNPVGFSQ